MYALCRDRVIQDSAHQACHDDSPMNLGKTNVCPIYPLHCGLEQGRGIAHSHQVPIQSLLVECQSNILQRIG